MLDLVKDELFDIQKTKDYKLSIQVSLDGFSFLIVHPVEKRILAFENSSVLISSSNLLARRLKEWLEEQTLLKNQFKSITVQFASEQVQLIPESFFDQAYLRNITSSLFDKKEHNHFLENKIQETDIKLIYPVSRDILAVLKQFFNKNIHVVHPVAHLLKRIQESKIKNRAFIMPHNKFFYLVLFNNSKLILANSFPAIHQNDLVYYIINVFKQLEINRNNTVFYLSGCINHNKEIRDLIKPYFLDVRNLNVEDFISNPGIITNTLPLYLSII